MSPLKIICVLSFSALAAGSNIPWWNVKLAQEQGPNVCVIEDVPGTKHKIWTECKYWKPRDICGQKPILRYDCCEGYRRVSGTHGCVGVKPLKDIIETVKEAGARLFAKYIEESGSDIDLKREGTYTLFAPSDEAMEELPYNKRRLLDSYKGLRSNPIIQYHTTTSKLLSSHFMADNLKESLFPGYNLRINKFSSRIETVNCARILRKDNEASNGVVHIIDSVLDPFDQKPRNLFDLITKDDRFTIFANALRQSTLVNKLRESDTPYTVLVPSDEAFQKMPSHVQRRLLDNEAAREETIKNHVIPHALCLPAIIGLHKIRTGSNEKISFDCTKREHFLEGRRIKNLLTMGNNGMAYMIDDVLLPDKAKSIIQLLEDEKAYGFLQIIRSANLEDTFEGYGHYTVFAPSQEAIMSMPNDKYQELLRSREKAKKFVLHHVVHGKWPTYKLKNNERLMSLDEEHPLRFHIHRKNLGVEDAIISLSDKEGINGVLHIISRPLHTATHTWEHLLSRNSSFSSFYNAYTRVKDWMGEYSGGLRSPKTLLVPNNDAFRTLSTSYLHYLTSDSSRLTKVIKNHLLDTMVPSDLIAEGLHYDMKTAHRDIELSKKNGFLKVNDAVARECDLLSSNGLVHVIDRILVPSDL